MGEKDCHGSLRVEFYVTGFRSASVSQRIFEDRREDDHLVKIITHSHTLHQDIPTTMVVQPNQIILKSIVVRRVIVIQFKRE